MTNEFNPRITPQVKMESGIEELLATTNRANNSNNESHDGNPLTRVVDIDGVEIKLYRKSFDGQVISNSGLSDTEKFTYPAPENPRSAEHLTEEALSHIQDLDRVQLYTAIAYISNEKTEDGQLKFAVVDGISRRQKSIYIRAPFHLEYSPVPLSSTQAEKIAKLSEQRRNVSPWERGKKHHYVLEENQISQAEYAKYEGISTSQLSRLLKLYRTSHIILDLFQVPTCVIKKEHVEYVGALENKLAEKGILLSDFADSCKAILNDIDRSILTLEADTAKVIDVLKSAEKNVARPKNTQKPEARTLFSSGKQKVQIVSTSATRSVITLSRIDATRRKMIEDFIQELSTDDLSNIEAMLSNLKK